MSVPDADESGEEFGASAPNSSDADVDDSDPGAQFCPMPERWTSEQLNVLFLRVDDWKASKNPKSKQLIVQGAMTELCGLQIAPPLDGLKMVSG
jgi:hypothetical protein